MINFLAYFTHFFVDQSYARISVFISYTAQKLKFSTKDFFSKSDQIRMWIDMILA